MRGPSYRDVHWRLGVVVPLCLAGVATACDVADVAPGPSGDVAWTAAAVAAVTGCLAARAQADAHHVRRWTLWALASAAWLFGQLMWDIGGLVGFGAQPDLDDLGYWGFAVLVGVSVLAPPPGDRSLRRLAAIETLPLLAAGGSLSIGLLWHSFVRSPDSLGARWTDLGYVALYGLAGLLLLQALLGGSLRRGVRTPSMRIFATGVALNSAAFVAWGAGLLAGSDALAGTLLLDPLWVLGLGCIAVAGLLAAAHPEPPPRATEPAARAVIVPAGLFVALFGAVVFESATGAPSTGIEILLFGLLSSGAALVARSMLLGRRVRGMLERERVTLERLREREAELARANELLVEETRHDPLTGVLNRRALAEDLPALRARLRADGGLAVVLCDLNRFKDYNDRFGHLAGDRALSTFAATVRSVLRDADSAYRYGGEEFLVVLAGATGPVAAVEVAERIRAAVERAGIEHPLADTGVLTVSAGVACGVESPEELIAHADKALYDAKANGRNRVALSEAGSSRSASGHRRLEGSGGETARHLRGMLAVSRAAAGDGGPRAVLEALSEAVHHELSFNVVAASLREPGGGFRTIVVLGDAAAADALLDTTTDPGIWRALEATGHLIHGAIWLPHGSYELDVHPHSWRARGVAPLASDGWHPDDMLLLPLRDVDGEPLAFLSVDQPAMGRRPSEDEIAVLMAVVAHAALAMRQAGEPAVGSVERAAGSELAAALLLAETLDLRDASTALHSRTVGELAQRTAIELGLGAACADRLYVAGVLHDLGKLGVADAILHKPSALDDAEWGQIRRHPEMGARILEQAGLRDIASWILGHHERLDGAGYPRGLSGAEISMEARILSVADSYEAMTARRPYRAPRSAMSARAELRQCAGSQFDPVVVDAFLRAVAGPDESAGPLAAAGTRDD